MTPDLLVGIDVGGTKTHLRVETTNGELRHDRVIATADWRGSSDASKARLITGYIGDLVSLSEIAAVAIGAHGCDSDEESESLRRALADVLFVPTTVVNDAQLLGAAAGLPGSIELVAGTGSIAVGRTPEGHSVYAGGWGWLLGDEGGAAGLVREAVRLLTRAADEGAEPDVLEALLLEAAGVSDLRSLGMLMMSGAEFTAWAPVLFTAADAGSPAATVAIRSGAHELARLAELLLGAGVRTARVVAAGSVIVRQPQLADALRAELEDRGLSLHLLDTPPVRGALQLARLLHQSLAPSHSTAASFTDAAIQRKE
jgi:glucosamine kinase